MKTLLQHKLANLLCTFSVLKELVSITEFQATETNSMRDFKLPLRSSWVLCSAGLLHNE